MGITVTALTVLGTACPWKLGTSTDNPNGSTTALVAHNSGNADATAAAGGTGTQNSAFRYGRSHTNASETGPTTLAVTPFQTIVLQFNGGTVATGASGAGNSPPAGSTTTTLTPAPGSETTGDGYVQPSNMVLGWRQININGTVNTSGTAVTWVSGGTFDGRMTGQPIWINNALFLVSKVNSSTSLTLSATAGTQTGVAFFVYSATNSIGGLVGAFTDGSGNVLSTFDWSSFSMNGGAINTNNTPGAGTAFTLSSVALASGGSVGTTVYTGTITGGGNNALAGFVFTITGFTNAVNNGTFFCVNSSTTTLALANLIGIAETHAATATEVSYVTLIAPSGAAFMSLGISDAVLNDNTGSFSFTAFQMDTDYLGFTAGLGWAGDNGYPKTYPTDMGFGLSPVRDYTNFKGVNMKQTVAASIYYMPQTVFGAKLIKGHVGQLFPRGAQSNAGSPPGVGQNFSY